jgi:hypothetical protein
MKKIPADNRRLPALGSILPVFRTGKVAHIADIRSSSPERTFWETAERRFIRRHEF